MRVLILLLILAPAVLAQDKKPVPTKSAPATKPAAATKPATAAETEDQKSTRAISLNDLEEADRKMTLERRLNMLLEDLDNRKTEIETKTTNLARVLDENKKKETDDTPEITQEQLDHWNSRQPLVAAKDFMILYRETPEVAVGIVKGMKKKKGAALIDAVSSLGEEGRTTAARLHEAIGTRKFEE
jgi:NAD-specific glutamate dehydrogenase